MAGQIFVGNDIAPFPTDGGDADVWGPKLQQYIADQVAAGVAAALGTLTGQITELGQDLSELTSVRPQLVVADANGTFPATRPTNGPILAIGKASTLPAWQQAGDMVGFTSDADWVS